MDGDVGPAGEVAEVETLEVEPVEDWGLGGSAGGSLGEETLGGAAATVGGSRLGGVEGSKEAEEGEDASLGRGGRRTPPPLGVRLGPRGAAEGTAGIVFGSLRMEPVDSRRRGGSAIGKSKVERRRERNERLGRQRRQDGKTDGK
jgi:hypothetical protein